jgi:hypothetical protein
MKRRNFITLLGGAAGRELSWSPVKHVQLMPQHQDLGFQPPP